MSYVTDNIMPAHSSVSIATILQLLNILRNICFKIIYQYSFWEICFSMVNITQSPKDIE